MQVEDLEVAKIQDWLTPNNATDVRSIIGLASYYRKFVRGFSSIAASSPTHRRKLQFPLLYSIGIYWRQKSELSI